MFMSVNEPEHFSWHDAAIKSMDCENRELIWKVDALNVLASNSQNSGDIDLCASTATVLFENYSIEHVKRYGFKAYQGGDLIEEQPDKVLTRQEISAWLDKMTHDPGDRLIGYIVGMESGVDGRRFRFSMDISDKEGVLCVDMTSDKFTVTWDGFKGKAWYLG